MVLYLLKSAACLVVFLLFYKFFLERIHWHVFKRFYLLGSIVLALSIPLITYTTYVVPAATTITYSATAQPIDITEVTEPPSSFIDSLMLFWGIYALGVLLFGIRFTRNLNRIIRKIRFNPKQRMRNITNVLLEDKVSPHTFLRYIFLNKEKFERQEIPQEVFWHEETHARQKHSLDILFIEFIQVLFWCNPLLYFVKKSIKLNHEFLADEAVLNKGTTPTQYQHILLAFSSNAFHPQLANAINYSSIKKRFTVMKTKTSKKSVYLRSLLLLPILAALIYSFSTEELVIQEQTPEEREEILFQETEQEKGATPAMMEAYRDFIRRAQTSKIIKMDELKRNIAIYEGIMTDEQRASVEKYPIAPSIDLANTKAKQPSQETLNAWHNKEKYAVWLDGKRIENTTLKNYKTKDIAYYTESFVHKNARSERFPQNYQVHLYTQKGFTETYTNANIRAYEKAMLTYSLAISAFLKSKQADHSELLILAAETYQLYEQISKEERDKHHIPPPPPPPAKRVNKQQKEVPNNGTALYNIDSVHINNNSQKYFGSNIRIRTNDAATPTANTLDYSHQEKASPKMVKEYNTLAKKYNAQPKESRVVKLKDLKRLEGIYKAMTTSQRKKAEAFPECPPTPSNKQEKATKKMVAEYNALAKKYHKLLSKRGNIQIKKGEVDRMKYIYSLMTDDQKKTAEAFPDFPPLPAPPPPPDAPEIAEIEIMEVPVPEEIEIIETPEAPEIVEVMEIEEIPMPPPPPNPLDLVIKMAKKGAKFYYNDKAISSDRAIEIVKKNKKINITLDDSNPKSPVMKLYNKPIRLTGKKGASQASTKVYSYAKKLAKNKAQFYYNSKAISSEKGLAIIKKNKVVVETYPWSKKNPEVKIFDEAVYQKAQIAKKAMKQIKSR